MGIICFRPNEILFASYASFTSSGTFAVPSGMTSLSAVLVVAGGGQGANTQTGAAGGPGIVIVRFPSDATLSVTPGGSTSTHPGGDKLATFTVSGTLTIS